MNPSRAKVFDKTYQNYLQRIFQMDYLAKATVLGLEREGDSLLIPVYNRRYRFNTHGITDLEGGELHPALQTMICKYILVSPMETQPSNNQLQPYREFKDAAPLISHFAMNATLRLEKAFAGKLDVLQRRCVEIGGEIKETEVYDLSFVFYAFPRIPVIVNFNDSDELFPAACSILYNSSAANYLDMECLSMTGTLLASILDSSNMI